MFLYSMYAFLHCFTGSEYKINSRHFFFLFLFLLLLFLTDDTCLHSPLDLDPTSTTIDRQDVFKNRKRGHVEKNKKEEERGFGINV